MQNKVLTSFSYRNDTKEGQVVYVEPWGRDYTLLPGQLLRVEAEGKGEIPHFDLQHSLGGFQLWCELTNAVDVFVDGAPVECGYNRGRSPT